MIDPTIVRQRVRNWCMTSMSQWRPIIQHLQRLELGVCDHCGRLADKGGCLDRRCVNHGGTRATISWPWGQPNSMSRQAPRPLFTNTGNDDAASD